MGRPRSTSLPYVPIDPHIDEHARTEALVDALTGHSAIPPAYLVEVVQKLIKLAGRKCIDGTIGQLSDRALAKACAWDGDAAVLREALVSTGWLECDENGAYRIHDWCDYGGIVLAKREENRARKAAQRTRKPAKKKGKRQGRVVTRNSAGCHADFRRLSHDMSVGHDTQAQLNAADNTQNDAKNGEKSPCVSTEKQSEDNELDEQDELSRGIPRDVTRFSALEGEGEYKKQPRARTRLVAPKSGIAAAAISPTALDGHTQWLIDNASEGLPVPTSADLQALQQVGRIDAAAWKGVTTYAQSHAKRSPWRYAAVRARERYGAAPVAQKPLRIDSTRSDAEATMREILSIGSPHGMGDATGAVADDLISIHNDEPIGEYLAQFCAEYSTRNWAAFVRWERDRRRNEAARAMARLAEHGFAVPIGDRDDRFNSNDGPRCSSDQSP